MTSEESLLPRLAILDDYQSVALKCADWSSISSKVKITVYTDTLLSEPSLLSRLEPYTIICTMRERTKFPRSVLSQLPNLKLLTTMAMRNASIDLEAAKEFGIVVCGTGAAGHSTVEHTWALILGAVRQVVKEHQNVISANPQWQTAVPMGLSGKTLGIVGVGRLGKASADIAKVFGMKVLAWSPHLTRERAEDAGVEFSPSKQHLFSNSDIVSVYMVLSPSTRHLISAEDFAAMQPHAYFINTSRGPLVDEDALIDALKKKQIAGAALDVYDIEPLPLDHPIRKLDNVTLSPHNAYVSDVTYKVFWGDTVDNIVSWLDGNPKRQLNAY